MGHRLEEKRKVKSAAYYARKKVTMRSLAEAKKTTKVKGVDEKLAAYGY